MGSGIEFVEPHAVRIVQAQAWLRQKDYVYERSEFLKKIWRGRKPPERLEDLPRLPFCDKKMLRQSQAAYPPFGDYVAAPFERIIRFHRTSGTTGQAMNLGLTKADADRTAEIGGRSQRASGLGPGDLVVHCLNYQMWMGGFTDHTALEATGATVVPFGVGNTNLLVRVIRELKITAISCTTSYPAVLENVLATSFPDLRPRDLGLRLGLFGGEGGLDNLSFRQRLDDTWGFASRNANYGVSDVLCNFAGQCEFNNDLHFMGSDALYAEIYDSDRDNVYPFEVEKTGELVLTHLAKECQPLVRFRTGDIVAVTEDQRCACGRYTPRFRVIGRTDDMVVIRGINVFPSSVAEIIGQFEELSGEYRIHLRGDGPYHVLPVEAELSKSIEEVEPLRQAIQQVVKRELRVTGQITLVAPNTFPRTEGKTKRVIRE